MSLLVINKFEPSEIRIYKRGNDNIDLDAYIRKAEAEFGYWLANSGLKDKEKLQVQEAYSKMILGINDGTFTYRIGGGYDNSIGMSNLTKGFDAAGLAAGFLGDILRKLNVISQLNTITKDKYSGTLDVGKSILKLLLGEAGNIQYFINLDPLVDGKRGNAVRLSHMLKALDSVASELKDNTNDWAILWLSDYNNIKNNSGIYNIDTNGNGILDDNEYLALSKLLGSSGIENLFYTGDTYGDTSKLPTELSVNPESNYPIVNTKLAEPLSLLDSQMYGKWHRDALYNHLSHLSKMDELLLFDLVNYALDNDVNLITLPEIKLYAGNNNITPFTNLYIIYNILKVLKDSGKLNQYADSSGNNFYIKDSYNKKRGTGLIWNIFNNTIEEASISDIPWWISKMNNISSNKNGGILKALLGTVMSRPEPYFKLGIKNTLEFSSNPKNWDNAFDFDKILGEIYSEDILNGENLVDTLNKLSSSTLDFSRNSVKTGYKDWNILYNTTGLNKFFGWDENRADSKGMSTYNRMALLKLLMNKYNSAENALFTGNVGVYYSNGKWLEIPGYKGEDPIVTALKTEDTSQTPEVDILNDIKKKFVFETHISPGEESVKTNDWIDYLPYGMRFGKLFDSLKTNRAIEKLILPSLKPVLKLTYERYSPVTGAFSTMLFKNLQAADIINQSNLAFTSDPNLIASRMLEGQRLASQALTEGHLANNLEIHRTQAEALARLEDNMARRSENANFNSASNNLANREVAQVKASRLNRNYLSREGFYDELITDAVTRLAERRNLSNSFREQISQDVANRWFSNVMDIPNRERENWIKTHTIDGIAPDITDWNKNDDYNEYLQLAEDMRRARLKKSMGRIYNIDYTSPYTDLSYNMFSKKWI